MKPHLPKRPLADQPPCQITESKDKKDSGSISCGYRANVSDIKAVTDVRQYLIYNKSDVGKATHMIYAYRLRHRVKIQESFGSDRDWGTGHELLKITREHEIVNAVCTATRSCNPGY